MRTKWWHWVLLGLGFVMFLSGLGYVVVEYTNSTFRPFTSISEFFDKPEFTYDEVVALVKRDLLDHPTTVISSSDFTGSYVGHGKWSGTCRGQYGGGSDWLSATVSIEWNFYEKSQTTEIVESK